MAETFTYQPAPRFSELGDGFSDVVAAAEFPRHTLRFRNDAWAERVGLGHLSDEQWVAHFGRFAPLPENLQEPLALRYHGHQFRTYNPQLGDGRGFLFAQMKDAAGRLLDLGTKGSGPTPWSRGGDGKLTLKGGVREVLATEMLEALGVYTSKSFSLIETGESLERGDEPSPTRSAVLVRLSHSHVRFGSFQRHLAHEDPQRVRRLVEYSMRHYGGVAADTGTDADLPARFLQAVLERSADLCASWMAAGFVHGVLNTDNMNVTGESFDYGPYRFLPHLDLGFTAAYFDHSGLYAYGRQPDAVFWNLQRLAETLLALSTEKALVGVLEGFAPRFFGAYRTRFIERLGLIPFGDDRDQDFLSLGRAFLEASKAGYAQFFHDWFGGGASQARARQSPQAAMYAGQTFLALRKGMDDYEAARPEALEVPYFQRPTPEDLLIDEIEALWHRIATDDDWSAFEQKVESIRAMGIATGLRSDSRFA